MKTNHLLSALLVTASLSAHAFQGDQHQSEFRSRVDGVRTEMFAEFKAIESYSHRERVRTLQEAESCIQAAADRDQYRACEQREKESREHVLAQVKFRHDALRAKGEGMRQGMLGRRQ
jgi:hypothetical protein